MSDRQCPCTKCRNKFQGNGPLVTPRTISNHLAKEKAALNPSTTQLLQKFASQQSASVSPSQTNNTEENERENQSNRINLSLVLVCYLHVIAGLSQKEARTTLISIKTILKSLIANSSPSKIKFPIDIRTALKYLAIDPVIYRTLCCPGCFKLYPRDSQVQLCDHKQTARSRECGSPLFNPKGQPLRQYSTQSFQQWLPKFLQQDGIEDLLWQSTNYSPSRPGVRSCLWDGSIWSSFKDSEGQPFHYRFGNLSFGIYVDWFNPMGNKISGKHHSVGVIILFCLSLPASHRYQLQNLFFAGITPGPSEPSVLQMNNVLLSLVEELHFLWQPGTHIKTPQHPAGLLVKVALIAAVCDLPAIRKLIGYASHSATRFCLFCYLARDDNHCLNYVTWKVQTIEGHKKEAQEWKDCMTLAQRATAFKSTGVRWSVLNELPYWNPIDFTVVEPMHLLSGMLEWHARTVWGLDETAVELKNKKIQVNHTDNNQDYFNEDEYEQWLEYDGNPPPMNTGIDLSSLQEALMEIDDEIELATDIEASNPFSAADLSTIRQVILHARIPSWLNRPSPLFGDASAGKVRSADWITFFTVFMPFAVVELQKSKKSEFVDSWYHLAMLTELAMDYVTDDSKAQRYLFHLTSYRSNITEQYPALSPTPNHHMVFHLPKQLSSFGPANFLASWHFEQINGILQKVPTNKKINQLDATMLTHAGRAANLGIMLGSPNLPPLLSELSPLFTQKKKLRSLLGEMSSCKLADNPQELAEDKIEKFKNNFCIPAHLYPRILELLKTTNTHHPMDYVDEQKGDFRSTETAVPSVAKTIHSYKHMGLTYTDQTDKGSSTIEYELRAEGITKRLFGKIVCIMQMVLYEPISRIQRKHKLHTFICMQRFISLSPLDQKKDPYPKLCPKFDIHTFYAPPLLSQEDKIRFCDLITPNHLVYHAATYQHSSSIFQTDHDLLAVKALGRSCAGQFK